jgi:hypothetical protein
MTEALRFGSEPAALVGGEAKSSAAELPAEHPVLLPQVVVPSVGTSPA